MFQSNSTRRMILNVRAELSSTVNLLVTRITQDPQGKRDFAPSGKDVISFCVKTLEFLWRQSCSPLLPVALGRCLPQTPHRSPILQKDIFTALVFLQCVPLPDLRKSKCCEGQSSLVGNEVGFVLPGAGVGLVEKCGWNKEVGNSRVFSQSHGRPEGRCWPPAHIAKSKDPCHRFSSSASVAAALLDTSFLCEAAQPSLFTKLQKFWGEGDSMEKVSWNLELKGLQM